MGLHDEWESVNGSPYRPDIIMPAFRWSICGCDMTIQAFCLRSTRCLELLFSWPDLNCRQI